MAKLPEWTKDNEAVVGVSSLVIKRRRVSNSVEDKAADDADDGGLEIIVLEGSATSEW